MKLEKLLFTSVKNALVIISHHYPEYTVTTLSHPIKGRLPKNKEIIIACKNKEVYSIFKSK